MKKKTENKPQADSANDSRRKFLRNSAAALAGFYILPRHVLGGTGYTAPSDKLQIAGIGAGGKGESDLWNFFQSGKADIAFLCDVDERQFKKSRERYPKAKIYKDYREMLDKEAKKKSLPPFVIFLETSLQDMATLYPTTLAELEKCQGVSKGKALKYGKPFVEMVARYVEENDIEKPDDFVMKSVVNSGNNKIYIIQNVDKKIPLETIARNKSLRLDELLEEMETIAASGTKLNLDYAIDEWLDEYDQEEIIEYFKGCETSSLQIAQQELSENDYTWEQLKIMRIKFLSVYGN